MATSTHSAPHLVSRHALPASLTSTRPRVLRMERRRPTRTQGQALEALGHAVEYLIDSRLATSVPGPNEREAVEILKRASRAVFAECPEVRSWKSRLRNWIDADVSQKIDA